MTGALYTISELTVVLGPPAQHRGEFEEFQALAARGESVADHPWTHHEHAAVDALTHRDGSIGTHTLLETFIGGVLQVEVIVADVERQWVRHADGLLYAAITLCSEDVRPRAAGMAMHDSALVEALNAVANTISTLDGRAWMRWSSRIDTDAGSDEHTARTVRAIADIADLVLRDAGEVPPTSEDALDLTRELLNAIRLGRAAADTPTDALVRELRALRHLDPLRTEWQRLTMDAYYLAALDTANIDDRVRAHEASGLAWLYLGRERTDRLKADPYVTTQFRREIAAKTFMTAYALERLAPMVSSRLFDVISGTAPQSAA